MEFFYLRDENNDIVLIDDVPQFQTKPRCCDIDVLARLITSNAPQHKIDKYKQYCVNKLNWVQFDDWKALQDAYETEYAEVTDYNANPDTDENDQPILKEYPVEPDALNFVEATVETVNTLIASELKQLTRTARNAEIENIQVEVDGFYVDGDELSQTRMSRALLLMNELNVATYSWKCSDNVWRDLTQAQFTQAIYDAGIVQTTIMQNYP